MDISIQALYQITRMFGFVLNFDAAPIAEPPKSLYETAFSLPITYLDQSEIHVLSDIVATDLELVVPGSDESIYERLFLPKHEFAKQLIPAWRKSYTTNTDFLHDTQYVIQSMGKYNHKCVRATDYVMNCGAMEELWKDIKQNDMFMDTYNYIEWDILKQLNESSSFLQSLSMIHIASPVMSLLLPFFVLILPFLVLNIRGIPITFLKYLEVLKDIARHHFIGKLLSIDSFSAEKIAYLLVTFALYLLQIYQNVNLCQKFYKNIVVVNERLCELQKYVDYSIQSMDSFLELSSTLPTYAGFLRDAEAQCARLKCLQEEIRGVYPFEFSISKFHDVGYMLKCYYSLHSNPDYESCLSYSVGFEGYMNNLLGVYENVSNGNVSFAAFVESLPSGNDVSGNDASGNEVDLSGNTCYFKQQYYPPLVDENPVKNNCSLHKNIILSAPNKAGKTTILKTTTLNIIFSQQVGGGFYESAKFIPYTHIHSYLNIPDTSERDSLFQAESRRCKEILDVIQASGGNSKSRHFCIFDELYSGTNPDEASRAGYAFLEYLTKYRNVTFLLTTHYLSICRKFKTSSKIQNYKMDVRVLSDGTFEYAYKMKKGISKIKGAVRVLKDLEYPAEIIRTIESY